MFEIKNHLSVENNNLFIGKKQAKKLIESYGSPLFVINEERVRENFIRYKKAFPNADLYYAAKANGNITILKIMAELGAGADVFSDGELYMAHLAGIPKNKILFNGNSKTDAELLMAVETGVRVSIDSINELRTLNEIAKANGKIVDIAFRVNPDVSPDTHPYISTGLKTSKFGIPHNEILSVYKEAKELENVNPVGIHCHIGSQILNLSPFGDAMHKMMDKVQEISNIGIKLEFVDIGSGLGVPYVKGEKETTPLDLANIVLPIFDAKCKELGINPKLVLEPGRYIMADASILLATVNTMKETVKKFVGIDVGFNLLIRPAMYDSYHYIVVANKASEKAKETYTIVGPICETGDIIAKDRELPIIEKGDIIAILDAGAYGFSMSSQYNGRTRCAEILINGEKIDIIRMKESYSDLLANQIIPSRFL